jgi:hypothetical protein
MIVSAEAIFEEEVLSLSPDLIIVNIIQLVSADHVSAGNL